METTLELMTAVSLGLALLMGFLLWRTTREERRRSAARVAALVAEVENARGPRDARDQHQHQPSRPVAVDAPSSSVGEESPRVRLAASRPVPLATRPSANAAVARFDHAGDADPQTLLAPDPGPVPVGSMFAISENDRDGGMRWAFVAAMAIIVLIAAGFLWFGGNGRPSDGSVADQTAVGQGGGQTADRLAAVAPLELLALRHERHDDGLWISGLVRNPRQASARQNLMAVAFLFDRGGKFIASGRAPLDVRSLNSGDESSFSVKVPAIGAVERYRISFRIEDGSVVPHLDRRAQSSASTVSE